MKNILIVGLGGFIGSILRYKLGSIVLHSFQNFRFPIGTFLVNIIGCFLIGIVGGCAEHSNILQRNMILFLMTGVLGGFTTFSAFSYETLLLIKKGQMTIALAYVALSIFCGLMAVFAGFKIFN